ncbi:hypothetical protein CVT24_000714 [Panaeolus cyanescens]|uniref:Protein kinase domain-containing protein n=1 Tax=Panaeolus cyanescens TaxID=181874 RepID=A0A409YT18_9AGAR|nr:hypothetical protein CVT24_000714 [Panaeolus cyanescens]
MQLLRLPVFATLSLVIAGTAAFPTLSNSAEIINKRALSNSNYNTMQSVFSRNPEPQPVKPKTSGARQSTQNKSKTSGAGAQSQPYKYIQGSCSAGSKGKKKRDLEEQELYARAYVPPIVALTSDPLATSSGRRANYVGRGVCGVVYENPLNPTTEVIKSFSDAEYNEVYKEVNALSHVGQLVKWAYLDTPLRPGEMGYKPDGTGVRRNYYIFMKRIGGYPLALLPLWRDLSADPNRAAERTALWNAINIAVASKIRYYLALGIVHNDLYQDNVLITACSTSSVVVEFIDWCSSTISSGPITWTDQQVNAARDSALTPKIHNVFW